MNVTKYNVWFKVGSLPLLPSPHLQSAALLSPAITHTQQHLISIVPNVCLQLCSHRLDVMLYSPQYFMKYFQQK